MPSIAKTVVATALALALVGGGGATLAQPANAVHQHTAYVVLVAHLPAPAEPQVLTGEVPCAPSLLQKAWAAFSGREPCTYPGYAYAYPAEAPAPWESSIEWVNDSYFVDGSGAQWHVAEVVYRTVAADRDGTQLVKAMAGEILPAGDQPGAGGNYALPVNADHLGAGADELVVGLGPQPPVTPAKPADTKGI